MGLVTHLMLTLCLMFQTNSYHLICFVLIIILLSLCQNCQGILLNNLFFKTILEKTLCWNSSLQFQLKKKWVLQKNLKFWYIKVELNLKLKKKIRCLNSFQIVLFCKIVLKSQRNLKLPVSLSVSCKMVTWQTEWILLKRDIFISFSFLNQILGSGSSKSNFLFFFFFIQKGREKWTRKQSGV